MYGGESGGGWPCAPNPLGDNSEDKAQGGNQGNQTMLFITRGTGEVETHAPQFSYMGVRYAAISGLPAGFTPDEATLTVLRVNTLNMRAGEVKFNTSTPKAVTLTRVQNAVVYTQMSNVHSHPEDCPQRERHGWTADSQVAAAPASLNFDMDLVYTNWERTMSDIQALGCDVATHVGSQLVQFRDQQLGLLPPLAGALDHNRSALENGHGLPWTPSTPAGKVRRAVFSAAEFPKVNPCCSSIQ